MGKLTGIGIGPGAPDLITVRGARAIEQARTIFCPKGKRGKPGVAYRTAQSYIHPDTEVIEMDFPMISLSADRDKLEKIWEENAKLVQIALEKGDAVFLTLGDPMVYSTYSYIIDYLNEHGIETENIPGITSFCALASEINYPLTQGEESLAIISMTQPLEQIEKLVALNDNIILMKASSKEKEIVQIIRENHLEKHFLCLSNIGMETQKECRNLDEILDGIPYFSTILIKKNYEFD